MTRTPSRPWALFCTLLLAGAAWAQPLEPAETQPATRPLSRPAGGLLFVGGTDAEPYSFLDTTGRETGYDVEVMQAMAARLGVPVEVRLVPPTDGKTGQEVARELVLAGRADGVIGLGMLPPPQDEGRLQQWTLCGTLTREYGITVQREDTWVQRLADLDGTRVVMLEDDPGIALLNDNENVTLLLTEQPQRALRQYLLAQRAVACIADRNLVRYAARDWRIEGIEFAGQTVYTIRQHGPAVLQGRQDLAGQIHRAMTALEEDGTLAQLRQKWGFDFELNPVPWHDSPEFYWSLGGVAALLALILVLVAWRSSIRRAVEEQTRKIAGELEVVRKQLHDLQNPSPPQTHVAAPAPSELPAGPSLVQLDLRQLVLDSQDAIGKVVAGEAIVALRLDEQLPPVLGDAERIRESLVNLLRNAREAIVERRRQEPQLEGHIAIYARPARPDEVPDDRREADGRFLALAVRDNGCGMPPENVQRVFEAGYTTKARAAGQGLSVVYRTAAAHGGWIDVASAPNRGATFSVIFPAVSE